MCVKHPFRDLNSDRCPLHLTSTYTCEMAIAPRVCSGKDMHPLLAKILYIYMVLVRMFEFYVLYC